MHGRRYPVGPYVITVAVAAVIYAAIYLGQLMWPADRGTLSWNPLAAAIQLVTGESAWPPGATVLLLVAAALLVGVLVVLWNRGGKTTAAKGTRRMTEFERRVNANQNTGRIQERQRRAEMEHLHPDVEISEAGVQIGRALDRGRGWVLQSYRQCSAHIWGPGRGKTLTQVVRHSYYAPGAYVMTSNKTDGVKYVLAARALRHPAGRVWMFDPDRIFRRGERPAFTVELLAAVKDTKSAEKLATLFEKSAPTAAQTGGDAQFDPQGREFLAWCMLAAAVSGKTLRQVHLWVTEGNTSDPAERLVDAGFVGPVAALRGLGRQPERTRGSVFATAQRMASAMVHDHLMAWVMPTPGVPVFDPSTFATSTDTLVLLTQDKAGPLAAYVSSLVTQVADAAVAEAGRHASERLPVPMVMDLDECGNVVTLPDLPDWYTHFGSKGIIINSYFQSPAQGEATYGKERFAQLWDAAGARVYGGGIDNGPWLRTLSDLIGTYDKATVSTTTSQGSRSRSESTQKEDRASVADLANLPEWRAIVRTSNGVSVVVETVPVFNDPAFAEVMRAGDQIGASA
ncbi:type IV secretory system conjugative DNA transfer family protein [Microbacterium maritypicum]